MPDCSIEFHEICRLIIRFIWENSIQVILKNSFNKNFFTFKWKMFSTLYWKDFIRLKDLNFFENDNTVKTCLYVI